MKPVVHFNDVMHCQVGKHALVHPTDHPSHFVSNDGWAYTSMVLNVTEDEHGFVESFETQNTKYIRERR